MGEWVIICFDMWDSLGQRRAHFARNNSDAVLLAERYLSQIAPIDEHNRVLLDEFENSFGQAGESTAQPDGPVDADGPLILKLLGDGAMFAVPDHGEETVAAAIDFTVHAVRTLADRDDGLTFATSAALALGDIQIARQERAHGFTSLAEVYGYPIDLASRLVSVAAAHQVLVSRTLEPHLGSLIERGRRVRSGRRNVQVVLYPPQGGGGVDDGWIPVGLPGSSEIREWLEHPVKQVVVAAGTGRKARIVGLTDLGDENEPVAIPPILNRWERIAELNAAVHELELAFGPSQYTPLRSLRRDLDEFCKNLREKPFEPSEAETRQADLRGLVSGLHQGAGLQRIRSSPSLAADQALADLAAEVHEGFEVVDRLLDHMAGPPERSDGDPAAGPEPAGPDAASDDPDVRDRYSRRLAERAQELSNRCQTLLKNVRNSRDIMLRPRPEAAS